MLIRLDRRLVLLPVLLLSVLFGCATDRAVIDQAQTFHAGLEPAVMEDAELASYLQKVGDRIIDAAKELDAEHYGPKSHKDENSDWMFTKDMKFHFVNSKTLNAFTTGGEHMYIYNELFQDCRSEDELAAVMAHEYGHVYARHIQKGMNRQYAILGGAAALGAAGYAAGGKDNGADYAATFASAGLVAGQFIGMGFTRKDEAEADQLGFNFYTHAGWDPDHFGDFFQYMIDKGFDKGSEMLSDHPSLKSRVDLARNRSKELPPNARDWRKAPVADAAAFKKLQQRAATLAKSMPDDKSLAGAKELLAALPRSCLTPAVQPDQQQAAKKLAEDVKKSAK